MNLDDASEFHKSRTASLRVLVLGYDFVLKFEHQLPGSVCECQIHLIGPQHL